MTKVKITIIGGGSYNWSPIIIKDIVATENLEGEIFLQDINARRLEELGRLGQKICRLGKDRFRISISTSRQEALQNADFVILTISTGGLEAMRVDLEVPLKYGIYQSVGDTVGPGGLSRALRNIPVVAEIGKDVRKYASGAWLINYTNPMSTLTRTLNKTTNKSRVIGCCHELVTQMQHLKKIFNLANDKEIKVKVAGINHFIWLLDLKIKGKDGFLLLRKADIKKGYRKPRQRDIIADQGLVKFSLFNIYGALPIAGDRHIAEFFPYFLTTTTNRGEKYGIELTTIEDRYKVLESAKEKVKRMLEDKEEISLGKSHEAASSIISAIANHSYLEEVMNLPNKGQITNLPQDVIVETMGVVTSQGVKGFPVGDIPPGILAIIYPHVIRQEMIVEAGLKGDKKFALEALASDPLVNNISIAKKLLDELIKGNKKYLPCF